MTDLQTGCAELGLRLSDRQIEQLALYEGLLLKWNKAINLISRRDIDRLVPRHLLDSLAVAPWIGAGSVLDVGSGGGLPGIPLAIALKDRQFTLCERMTRRARFLTQVVRELNMQNVSVSATDAEQLPPEASFTTIVARAVASPQALWKLLSDRLADRGSMLVFGSTREVEAGEIELAGNLDERDSGFDGGERLMHRVSVPGMAHAHTLYEIRRI